MRIRPLLCLLLVIVTSVASTAYSRTRPNISERTLRHPRTLELLNSSGAPATAAAASGANLAAVAVSLPVGAVQIDSTTYDLQDMGGLGRRIVRMVDGSLHVTWQDDFCELDVNGCPPNLALPNPFLSRGMGYASRSVGGTWTNLSKVRDPELPICCALSEDFGGFGGMDMTLDGRACIAQHLNEDGCDLRGDLYIAASPGSTDYAAHLTPFTNPSFLFPQVVANDNGSFTMLGEIPLAGVYDETLEFRISFLDSAGGQLVCPFGVQSGPWTSVIGSVPFRDGFPAFPSLDGGADGRVGIAVGDFGGNVLLIESNDGTFAAATITVTPITSYTDVAVTATDSTSTEYRSYVNCHLAYNGSTPHVTWSELQARRNGLTVEFFDYHSRIMHWSPASGISVVKQVEPGEADSYDNLDNGTPGPLAGFNTISVDWPQVGFSEDGINTYVSWLRFLDAEVDTTAHAGTPGLVTGIGFGDVMLSASLSGTSWSPEQNLTQTPMADERYHSMVKRNEANKVQILFSASATNEAGTVIIGDRGVATTLFTRRIAYLERVVSAVTDVATDPSLSVSLLQVHPNPAQGRARFSLANRVVARQERLSIKVYSLDGRLVSRTRTQPGQSFIEWNGLNMRGEKASSGIYFVRLEGRAIRDTKKFVLLN